MYDDYIYPSWGQSGTLTFSNLSAGMYSVYAYSFDGNFALSAGTNAYGAKTTTYNIAGGVVASSPPPWVPGLDYASWTNVFVSAGQPLVLTVMPGPHDGYAVISGLQLLQPPPGSFTNTLIGWGSADLGGVLAVPGDIPNISAVAGGMGHGLALQSVSPAGVQGAVSAWGDNTYNQTAMPAGLSNVTAIAAGPYHSLALNANGTVSAWGCWLPCADGGTAGG